jgi:hypothetical protein
MLSRKDQSVLVNVHSLMLFTLNTNIVSLGHVVTEILVIARFSCFECKETVRGDAIICSCTSEKYVSFFIYHTPLVGRKERMGSCSIIRLSILSKRSVFFCIIRLQTLIEDSLRGHVHTSVEVRHWKKKVLWFFGSLKLFGALVL